MEYGALTLLGMWNRTQNSFRADVSSRTRSTIYIAFYIKCVEKFCGHLGLGTIMMAWNLTWISVRFVLNHVATSCFVLWVHQRVTSQTARARPYSIQFKLVVMKFEFNGTNTCCLFYIIVEGRGMSLCSRGYCALQTKVNTPVIGAPPTEQ